MSSEITNEPCTCRGAVAKAKTTYGRITERQESEMARIKKCISCGEPLICMACKKAQNPEAIDWRQINLRLSADQKTHVEKAASDEGISVNEFIRRSLGLEGKLEDADEADTNED